MLPSPAEPQVEETEPVTSAGESSKWLFRQKRTKDPIEPSARTYREPVPINSRAIYAGGSYRLGQISVLLTRYTRIAGELGIEAWRNQGNPAAQEHAILCASLLATVKEELESKHPKLALCANLLGMADRELVSLYSTGGLTYRISAVDAQLAGMQPVPQRQLDCFREAVRNSARMPAGDDEMIRTALKDALAYVHGCDEKALIEDDLQVTRLGYLVVYVLLALGILLGSIPLISAPSGTKKDWPVWTTGLGSYIDLLIACAALAGVGAVGGIISGMFRVRDSRAELIEYRTSIWKLGLKPLVGAIAALIVYLFLSAGVVDGISVTNSGVYIVAAFLAGFSERYFLRILHSQEANGSGKAAGSVKEAGPASTPSAPRLPSERPLFPAGSA